MYAMQPVWTFLGRLEGFEFVAFWVAAITGATLIGFALDYVMQRQGFGPYVNALFAAVGVCAGLFVRYNYLAGYQFQLREPLLSLGCVIGATALLLLGVSFVRNRFS